jgi:hypothetical protein
MLSLRQIDSPSMDVSSDLPLQTKAMDRSSAIPTVRSAIIWVLFVFAAPATLRGLPKDESGKTADESKTIDREITATLDTPYDDLRQQAIPFGLRSFYLAPWKAYLDTWPASQYLNCLGINFNVDSKDAQATAQVLAEAGFRSARVEFGWGNLGYEDPKKIRHADEIANSFRALREAGIRPLVLLNSNSIYPVPVKAVRVKVLKPALSGAREIFLDQTGGIRPGYTGLTLVPAKIGFPLVVTVDPATGRCELSAPLPRNIEAGPMVLADLKFHPFSGSVLADGTTNPWAAETVEGWKSYVQTVCQIVKEDLGTEGQADAGFDLEVWNELTFGSDFLSEGNYYEPKRAFKTDITYKNHGIIATGVESILPITVDYVNDPANHLPGVRVISGFSNQRPWESGTTLWPGQTGFSRHFYTSLSPDSPFGDTRGFLSPATNNRPQQAPVNALGEFDGISDGKGWHRVIPGSYFVPRTAVSMPEVLHYGYVPECMTRDIQPFPAIMEGHFRFSNRYDGHPAQVWMTETNTGRFSWLDNLRREQQLSPDNPELVKLSHHLGAKALLRTFVFGSHKGIHTINVFAAREHDLQFAVLPEAFFATLKSENHVLTGAVRAQTGEQLAVLSRVTRLMREGEVISVTRPLSISQILEHEPRLVFKGDGTPAHPDRFNQDDFACLPFQLGSNRFVLAYYVVTQDMTKTWRPELDRLNPARYDMPPQTFDVTVTNVVGKNATVSAWDPFSDSEVPASVLASTPTTLTIRLETVDYPRFLTIEEADPGLLLLNPQLNPKPDGAAQVSFQTNLPASAEMSWGAWPQRNADGRVALGSARQFEYTVPHLAEHEGVKISIDRNGIVIPWPRWNYDVAGVLWPRLLDYAPTLDPMHPPSPRLPGLSLRSLPEDYETLLPSKLQWVASREGKTVVIGAKPNLVRVTVAFLVLDRTTPPKLLPQLSVLDDCQVTVAKAGGAEGWRAEIRLDRASDPIDGENYQLIYIFPTAKGWLELKFAGTEAALANRDTIQQILAGLRFRFAEQH